MVSGFSLLARLYEKKGNRDLILQEDLYLTPSFPKIDISFMHARLELQHLFAISWWLGFWSSHGKTFIRSNTILYMLFQEGLGILYCTGLYYVCSRHYYKNKSQKIWNRGCSKQSLDNGWSIIKRKKVVQRV